MMPKPKLFRPRTVPFSIREAVECELDQLGVTKEKMLQLQLYPRGIAKSVDYKAIGPLFRKTTVYNEYFDVMLQTVQDFLQLLQMLLLSGTFNQCIVNVTYHPINPL